MEDRRRDREWVALGVGVRDVCEHVRREGEGVSVVAEEVTVNGEREMV